MKYKIEKIRTADLIKKKVRKEWKEEIGEEVTKYICYHEGSQVLDSCVLEGL